MIEYYTFEHRGEADDYNDRIFMSMSSSVTMALVFGSSMESGREEAFEVFGKYFSEIGEKVDFLMLADEISKQIGPECQYLILEICNNQIAALKYGNVNAKIVMGGELRDLPNGVFGLSEGDKIICATSNFYKYLSDEAILCDAVVSDSCYEWMSFLVRRISDKTELCCGNLTAVTFTVKP